jgi:Phosphoglyceromutase
MNSPDSRSRFHPEELHDTLGHIVLSHGLLPLLFAYTDMYAHVLFFFNRCTDTLYRCDYLVLIPSPLEYPTYDLIPDMSAFMIKDELVRRIRTVTYDMIVCDFANCDMVGHTGMMSAAIQAV